MLRWFYYNDLVQFQIAFLDPAQLALWPCSAEELFYISRLSRSAERSKRIFTGGGVAENGSCSATSCGSAALRASRPLPHKTKSHRFCISASTMASYWSGRRGSNSLPPPWQGGALPDELRPHIRCICPCTIRMSDPDRARTDDPQRDRLVL